MVNNNGEEFQDVRYIRELTEYWNAYMNALINEIYVGVAVNLGLSESQAYRLTKEKPNELRKGFWDDLFGKFKNLFPQKIPKFRISKKIFSKGNTLSPRQWEVFNAAISDYWKRHSMTTMEDVVSKAYILGRKTTDAKRKKTDIRYRTLEQINVEGKLPSRMIDVFKTSTPQEKKVLADAFSRISIHVTETGHDLEMAIRKNITKGFEEGKSSQKIASNLFWDVQVASGSSAEKMRKNWNRIGITETQFMYEAGILSPYEEDAELSLSGEAPAQYFVFHGGTCKWCQDHAGTIVRLIPSDKAKGANSDSLSELGIEDPVTDIAIWQGKNNVGRYSYKAPRWMVCTPAHPHNVATMTPINPDTEFYNKKTGRVERKQENKNPLLPKIKNFQFTKEEKANRKPRFIAKDTVTFNDNTYKRVSPDRYQYEHKKWQENPRLPIPIPTDSTRYEKIFEGAENKNEF